MKCTIAGCPGVYDPRTIVHTVKHRGEVMVIDHVPAQVCNVCGDVLLAPETVRRIEALLKATPPPSRNVPHYEFAWGSAGLVPPTPSPYLCGPGLRTFLLVTCHSSLPFQFPAPTP